MRISNISCDICDAVFDYPEGTLSHEHPELEIGGVPMNIWTPSYSLPHGAFHSGNGFQDYIPIKIIDSCLKQGDTPLLIAHADGISGDIYLKDESCNPTGSFKDRGMAVMVSDAVRSGKGKIAIPSTGNAAISLGYYSDKAGLESIVFIPESTSAGKIGLIGRKSEIVYDRDLIESYEHFIRFCKENQEIYNGFPATNIPYLQGIKSMAYEMFIGLESHVPDWVVVPVGSGGDLVGLYYGFKDIMSLGLADKLPRFVSVQIAGADPITKGFNDSIFDRAVVLDEVSDTEAESIASDTSFNYFKLMAILKETEGMAVSVSDQEIESVSRAYRDKYEFSSLSVLASFDCLRPRIMRNDKVVAVMTALNREAGGGPNA
jgi:threonine synthase